MLCHIRSKARFFTSSSKPRIGFIGLGNMGASMAQNLAKSFEVHVFDIVPENVTKVVKSGAKEALSVHALSKESDIIITMVPATQHVVGLLKGPNGVFENARPGTLIIDSSTIDPTTSKDLILEARSKGFKMIDAPVSGGVTGAAAGTLTFMVGGDAADLHQAKPALEAMGKKIVHCGEAGSGGVAKLCNNLALAISMIGTSEALTLGSKLGMDPSVLSGILNTSTARQACWSSDSYNPAPGVMPGVPASRNYSGGFGCALMEKDLMLAMGAARAVGARLPLGSSAHTLYGLLVDHGYAHLDFSAVHKYLSEGGSKK